MKQKFDVVIIGGGMVGAAVASCLGNSELQVALIETQTPSPFSQEQAHDLRVSALSIASKNIMQTLGAWQAVTDRRYCPFKRMRVWEDMGDTTFNCDDIRQQVLGYIVENRVIQLAFLDTLPSFPNIKLFMPCNVNKINYNGKETEILLENGEQITANLLVAADGGHSRVRQSVGIGVTSWDYNQQALVIYVETAYPQQDITWQRFVPTGPQAFLPLTGNFASLVWYHSPDEVRRLQTLAYPDLLKEMELAFPDCLGDIKQILGCTSFSLKRQHAQQYLKQGVVLVGDAAHMINPLAGQGVNIGLLDAAALAEVLVKAKEQGKDIADLNVLKEYEKLRRNENLKMMTLMDMFYLFFSNNVFPVKFVRNFGLGFAQRISPVRHLVMKMAMGLEGNLPKLARGQSIVK